MPSTRAKVGILSIGEMGLGIANLLQAHNYHIYTTLIGRSPATAKRAQQAGIEVLEHDIALVSRCDYILSVVPPRDAPATAERIIHAFRAQKRDGDLETRAQPLYYLDLNAIAPSTSRRIARDFSIGAPEIRFLDGGIIGMAPTPILSEPADAGVGGRGAEGGGEEEEKEKEKEKGKSANPNPASTWKRPSIPLSGPHALSAAPISGKHLFETLNAKDLGASIGSASGLKASFAALTKGLTGLAIQAFSSAQQMDVLPQLRQHLAEFNPMTAALAERGVAAMPSKAYRWAGEMDEIGTCFAEEGGWAAGVFGEIAAVYRFVADETEVGRLEGKREVGEVVDGLVGGLAKRQKREDGGRG